MVGILLHKFFNPAGGVNQFLLTGKKGMAGGAYLNLHFRIDRSKLYFIPAGTLCCNLMVLGMDIFFHFLSSRK